MGGSGTWLTRNRPGKCFGQRWSKPAAALRDRFAIRRPAPHQSSTKPPRGNISADTLVVVENNTFCCVRDNHHCGWKWLYEVKQSGESAFSFVQNDDERRGWAAEKLRENDSSVSLPKKKKAGSKIEAKNGNCTSLLAPPSASDGEPGCQSNR